EAERHLKEVEPRRERTHQLRRPGETDVPVDPHQSEGEALVLGRLAEAVVEAGLKRDRLAGIEDADLRPRPRPGARTVLAQELAGPDRPREAPPLRRDLTGGMGLRDRPAVLPAVARSVGGGKGFAQSGVRGVVLTLRRVRKQRGKGRLEGPAVDVAVEKAGEQLYQRHFRRRVLGAVPSQAPGYPESGSRRRWHGELAVRERQLVRRVDADRREDPVQRVLPAGPRRAQTVLLTAPPSG